MQNTGVLAPKWLLARTSNAKHLCVFLHQNDENNFEFWSFFGVRMALGQTWFAHMQEPFTRIPNLVLTQKSHLAPYFSISQNTAAIS